MATIKSNKKKLPPIKIENAKIIYKNFAGAARQFNAAGLRNFHVVLDNDLAETLKTDGWNVRWHEPKEGKEGQERWASLKVAIRFDNYPPRVVLISNGRKANLEEDSISILDDAELETVDLIISPSAWERADGSGIKAYLKTMYAVLSPHDLEAKYMSGGSAQRPEDD
jgi:hypothetical protein